MKIEVNGLYLSALERIADEYNKETLELWNSGKSTFLRAKESAETIFSTVIIGYLNRTNPQILLDLQRELSEELQRVSSKQKVVHEKIFGTADCVTDWVCKTTQATIDEVIRTKE